MTTTSSVSSTSPSAPTVNLGNAQDVGSLVASNVDLSLADAVTSKVQPYIDQATAIQTEINTNQTQIAAYQNMQSLLQALQTAASNLTTESLDGSNVFQSRAADLSSSSSTAASSILSASVANGTDTGTHSVVVNQLAQAEADTSNTLALSSTATLSSLSGSTFNGSITIAESGKSSPQAVAVSSTMTLSQLAAAINAASATNGVDASVVSVDSSHQVLVLSAQDADTPLSFTDSNSILQALGVTGSTLTGTTAVSDPTAALGYTAGGFTITAGSDTATVTVTPTSTLNDIITQIEAGGQFTASQSDGKLQITDTAGNPIAFSAISGNAFSSLGLPTSGAAQQVTAPQALNLTVDGVKGITRTSNTVSDVLSGVTMNLTQADPNTTVTLQIQPDANTAASAVQSFVTAYNSWESFVQQNEATDSSGAAASGAVLFGNSSLRDASLQIDEAVTAEVNGTSLGALGISLNSSNQMVVDSTTLDDSLNNNFDTVANLFQSTLTTSSANLTPSGTNLASFAGTFTLGITMTGSNITGLTLNGKSAAGDFIFAGNSIQGQYGTPYSGMYFTYNGTGETVTVSSTQGIASQVYTSANDFASTTSGSLQTLIEDDQNENLSYSSQYNNWVNEANDYTNFLLTQYSSLTSQIQASGQTLDTLNALVAAGNSSNG
jgi:flagellar hook-associated protein 2